MHQPTSGSHFCYYFFSEESLQQLMKQLWNAFICYSISLSSLIFKELVVIVIIPLEKAYLFNHYHIYA